MLEISKSTLFDPIKSLKGIGPKTLQLFEKLCGTKIIDLLLTIPRGLKKR